MRTPTQSHHERPCSRPRRRIIISACAPGRYALTLCDGLVTIHQNGFRSWAEAYSRGLELHRGASCVPL